MGQKNPSRRSSHKLSAKRCEEIRRTREVLIRHWPLLKRRKGVHGAAVGFRQKDGARTDEVVLQVFVDEKLSEDRLSSARCIGPKIEGVPVDIVVRDQYQALTSDAGFDTLQGGVAIFPESAPSKYGTLGITVYHVDSHGKREPYFLTNAHVVMGCHDTPSNLPPGEKMMQAPQQAGKSRVIGEIIPSKTFRDSLVDCAFVKVDCQVTFLPGIRGLPVQTFAFGELTERDVNHKVQVIKVGVATGQRTGVVKCVKAPFIEPGTPGHLGANFFLQIAIGPVDGGLPFSAKGDSGAVVVRGNEIVGLLHGIRKDGLAIASHIKEVNKRLNFQL